MRLLRFSVYVLIALGAFSFIYAIYAWLRSGILVALLGGLIAAVMFWALAARLAVKI